MKYKLSWLFAAFALSACGILGITTDNDPAITDPAVREEMLTNYENTPLAKHQDSLLAKIDAATVTIPPDLSGTILLIETYDYEAYVNTLNIKYHRPDSAKLKKRFLRYSKNIAKKKLLKNQRYRTVYAARKTYATFDPAAYRYVLRETIRIDADRDHLTVHESGFVAPFVATAIYYLYDRQTGAVFREIKDLDVLEK